MYEGRLSFEYAINHKNWGFIDSDEPFELFYEGQITTLFSPDYPKTIGMFELMIYEFDKAKKFNQFDSMIEMISELSHEHNSRFTNFNKLINNHYLEFKDADRVIFLKNVIIHPDNRGKDVLDELIKNIYLTHYTKNSLFLLNSFPAQHIEDELEYFYDDYTIEIVDGHNNKSKVLIGDYFKLKELPKIYDEEIDYKLFARMQKLNFKKFEDTHYFYLDNDVDILPLFKRNEKL